MTQSDRPPVLHPVCPQCGYQISALYAPQNIVSPCGHALTPAQGQKVARGLLVLQEWWANNGGRFA